MVTSSLKKKNRCSTCLNRDSCKECLCGDIECRGTCLMCWADYCSNNYQPISEALVERIRAVVKDVEVDIDEELDEELQ